MSLKADFEFEFEKFEDYFGEAEEVKKNIDTCTHCGAKVSFGHITDYSNMLLKESINCPECGATKSKKIHIIN